METAGLDVAADNQIQHRTTFDFVRYANCWEDADILVAALHPRPGTRVLSIASAGDNTLALLAEGAEVIAADLSIAQLACLELRCAAFGHLDYDELLAFLGVQAADDRLTIYASLESHLSSASRTFWAAHPQHVAGGIIHAGKFEAYFRTFRTRVLPLIHSRKQVARLLEPKDAAARRAFWNDSWNNWRWRLLFRVFFSRFLMGRLGRDPEFFRYVEGSVSDRIMQRARYALTVLPTDCNPYLDYIATGNFSSALPRYLRREHFEAIRSGLGRLTLFHGPIEQAAHAHAAAGFDAFNLSDIFEYVSSKASRALYGELLNFATPGARLAYWNTLVPRTCPPEYAGRARPLTELSAELFARDNAFFYCHFQVDEVAGD
jgi:S-adenosylmethionine-diacylglycerol 3-amino-3-carboxypropyl transferase